MHQHLNTTRTGARATWEQSRWTERVWFSLGRQTWLSWEAPTSISGPGLPQMCCYSPGEPWQKLKQMARNMPLGSSRTSLEQPQAGQGAPHQAQALKHRKATQRKGPLEPWEATGDGRSLLEISVATMSSKWSGWGARSSTDPLLWAVTKQGLFALPLCKTEKGGREARAHSTFLQKFFTPCGLLQYWFSHCKERLFSR